MTTTRGKGPVGLMSEQGQNQSETGPTGAGAPAEGRHAPAWRAVRRRAISSLIVLPLVATIIAALLLTGREVAAPGWLEALLEQRTSELLEGGALEVGELYLTVGANLGARVRLTNTVLTDADGQIVAQVPWAEALLTPGGLLRGEALPREITLDGVNVTLRRAADGSVAVALGAGTPEIGQASDIAGLLEAFDMLLARPEFAALRGVEATGLIVNYEDARAGRSWTLDGGRVTLDRRLGDTRMTADLSLLGGRAWVTSIVASYESAANSPAATMTVSVTDAVAEDIASQSPALSWLDVLEGPISAEVVARIDDDGALGPLDIDLRITDGALQPTPETPPIAFSSGRVITRYAPQDDQVSFSLVEIFSDWGHLEGSGQAFLREFDAAGWPGALIGQFAFDRVEADPPGLYPEPLSLDRASVEFRLRLDPFAVELGQAAVSDGAARLTVGGRIDAAPLGWDVALDAHLNAMEAARVMALWPPDFRPGTRDWFARNLLAGRAENLRGAVRLSPGAAPVVSITGHHSGTRLRVLDTLPVIEEGAGFFAADWPRLTIALDSGFASAPQGGRIALAGSTMTIPDATLPDSPAEIALALDGTITAGLSVLDLEPMRFLGRAGQPVTLADGRAVSDVSIGLPLKFRIENDEIDFSIVSDLTEVRSDTLIPNRVATSPGLSVLADRAGMTITGPLIVGQLPFDGTWTRSFAPGADGSSRAEASVELSQRFLDEFRIGLPPGSVGGSGAARLEIDFPAGAPPAFELFSDLNRVALTIPALNWSLAEATTGRLEITGTLAAVPTVDRIALNAPGLTALGRLELDETGGLSAARFERIAAGDWLDASVDLLARGEGQPLGVVLTNGSLDMRSAEIGGDGAGGGPLTVALDRLQISESIALTGFRGDFTGGGGLAGQFNGAINGGAPVQGAIGPSETGRIAVRILSADAGAVLRSSGVLENARGGTMNLVIGATGRTGEFRGTLDIDNVTIVEAPAIAALLDAISVVGLLQQLGTGGILFNEVDADFVIAPDTIAITRSSATSPSLGISLDGIYRPATKGMDFQGVISPLFLLNGIGAVLTRRGEGLIGFNYTLSGTTEAPEVGVNPLSVFTPGMFREIFRRPPPEVSQ